MILCTFEDGTTELRSANCLCVLGFDAPPRPPQLASHDALDGWCVDGRIARPLKGQRNSKFSWAWRITGEKDGVLTGEWQACHVESFDEQVARLTRERDAAMAYAARWKRLAKRLRFVLAGAEQDIAHLRRGAATMLAALSGERTDVKPSSLGAALVVWAGYVKGRLT